jgi:C-terminal processing protease CtpA/Prc
VIDVARDSPAARAGLRAGDRLRAIEGKAITDQAGMVKALAAAGTECLIEVDRRGIVEVLQLQEMQSATEAE